MERYLVRFTKESEIKFISHLDLLRTLQRMVIRSGLNVSYSNGFNPHISVAITQPLSVGMYSKSEYFDLRLQEAYDCTVIKEKLNEAAPRGIKILNVIYIGEKKLNVKEAPKSMSVIDAASYKIRIKYNNADKLQDEIKNLLCLSSWNTFKLNKRKEKVEIDIKPLIIHFDFKVEKNVLKIDTLVRCGSRKNLSPEILASFIKKNTEGADSDAFCSIERQELYTEHNKKLLPVGDYFSGKCFM